MIKVDFDFKSMKSVFPVLHKLVSASAQFFLTVLVAAFLAKGAVTELKSLDDVFGSPVQKVIHSVVNYTEIRKEKEEIQSTVDGAVGVDSPKED